ncbi:MAG: FAD binding domain-containing protein [Bacteroidota bacterium]
MLSNTIQWYFPSSIKEATKLIQKNGVILHGGGTKILEPQPQGNIKGLVDTGGLGLNYIKAVGKTIHIGSGATFADVAQFCRGKKMLMMLGNSLGSAASTPLRNRITIGGSLKDFPMWSNLYAPLLALDAIIEIVGERAGVFSLEHYASSPLIKSKHLIKEIRVTEKKHLRCGAKAFHVVRFEYPIFHIAAAVAMRRDIVEDARFFITGVKKKFVRLESAENVLLGKSITDDTIVTAAKEIYLTFAPDYKFSSEYKERVARIYFKDLLREIQRDVV